MAALTTLMTETQASAAKAHAQAFWEQGHLALERGLFKCALERYTKAADLLGRGPAAPASLYVDMAAASYQLHLYEQSIMYCDHALNMDPDCVKAFYQRGTIHSSRRLPMGGC